jgi:flagellar hook-length control protein FliK
MPSTVSANAAPVLPMSVSNAEFANKNDNGNIDSTQDKRSNSLFKNDLREVSAGKDIAETAQPTSADRNVDQDIDQLREIEALLSDYLERQIDTAGTGIEGDEGNGFPLSGSDLPAIAANIRQYLNDVLAAKRSGQQSVDLSSSVTGPGGVALLSHDGLAGTQSLERQLAAIADSLARLGEGVANTGEAGRSLLGALSQVVKGLQSSNDSSATLANQAFADSLAAASSLKAGDASLKPLSSLGISTERFSLDSHQVGMTELAVKDLSTAQNAMLAVTGNMRSGAVQSAAAGANPALTQAFNTQLELPLGSAQWGSQVLQRVAWLTGQGIAAAEIHLNPAELGPMQVRVDQRQDSATVVFTSHNSSTREAIEASLPRLRELFSEQGMELIDVDINSGEQEANAQQSDVDSQTQSQNEGDDSSLEAQVAGAQTLPSQTETIALHYGLIDAYA